MSWMWMNLSLAIVFFGAWAGIPLYLVLRNPSWSSQPADAAVSAPVRPQPATQTEHILLPPGAQVNVAS
jgi:hypothetical protein